MNKPQFTSKINWVMISAMFICSTSTIIAVCWYYQSFHLFGVSHSADDWGVFGDYIGGVVGTIFSILTAVLVYVTYKNQAENSLLQQFETTFFNLLQIQREIVKSIKGEKLILNNNGEMVPKELSGNDYIHWVAEELETKVTELFIQNVDYLVLTGAADEVPISEELKFVNKSFDDVFKGKENILSHYFRHLYHLVKYTDESMIPNKRKYIDFIQAQMSDDELYVVMWDSISEYGRANFLPLLSKYDFFENLRPRGYKDFLEVLTKYYPKTTFKYFATKSDGSEANK